MPLQYLRRRDWAHPSHICTGTELCRLQTVVNACADQSSSAAATGVEPLPACLADAPRARAATGGGGCGSGREAALKHTAENLDSVKPRAFLKDRVHRFARHTAATALPYAVCVPGLPDACVLYATACHDCAASPARRVRVRRRAAAAQWTMDTTLQRHGAFARSV